MNEKLLQNKLYIWRSGVHVPIVPNAQYFCGNGDIVSVTRAGYVHEYEIKITRADFKADFKKAEKHRLLTECFQSQVKKKYPRGGEMPYPNYFYYVTPENLIDVSEIPDYAGLLEFGDYSWPEEKKKAPLLHKDKIPSSLLIHLLEKLHFRYLRLRMNTK